jgi:hypothetical protein
MERDESKLRFRTPSEGRLKFLLIISISSFPNHYNSRRNLSGVAKTALAGEGIIHSSAIRYASTNFHIFLTQI